MNDLMQYIEQREKIHAAENNALKHRLLFDGKTVEDQILASAVYTFAEAVYDKARKAREKYGFHPLGWAHPDWQAELQQGLAKHVQKGDPKDVAVYAVFAWFHGWPTATQEGGQSNG